MPNWTTNTITFEGDTNDIKRLKALMTESFDFNNLIPMPESLDVVSGGITNPSIIAYVASQHGGFHNLITSNDRDVLNARTFLREHLGSMLSISSLDYLKQVGQLTKATFLDMSEDDLGDLLLKITDLLEEQIAEKHANDYFSKTLHNLMDEWEKMDEEARSKMLADGKVYTENIKAYGYPTWYDWCCENWGTKWPACDVTMEESERKISWQFHTAWCAPYPIIEKLEQAFPKLSYEYWYVNEDDFEHSYGVRFEPYEWDENEE